MVLSKKRLFSLNFIVIFCSCLFFNTLSINSYSNSFIDQNSIKLQIFEGLDTVNYTKTIEDEMTEFISSESKPLYIYQKFSIENSQYLNNVSIFIQDIIDEFNYTDENSWEVAILNCSDDQNGTPNATLGALKKSHPNSIASHWEVFDFQNSVMGPIFLNISRTCHTQDNGINKYWFAFRVKIPPDDTEYGGGLKFLYFNPDEDDIGEGQTFKFHDLVSYENFTINYVNEIIDPINGTLISGDKTSLNELDEDRYVVESDTNNLTLEMSYKIKDLTSGTSFFNIKTNPLIRLFWFLNHYTFFNSIDFLITTKISNIENINSAILSIKNFSSGEWEDMSDNFDIKQDDENTITYRIEDPPEKMSVLDHFMNYSNQNSMEFQLKYIGTGSFNVSIDQFIVNIVERYQINDTTLPYDPIIQELVYPNYLNEAVLNGTIIGEKSLDSLELNDDVTLNAQADTTNLSVEFKFNILQNVNTSMWDIELYDWGIFYIPPIYPYPFIPQIDFRITSYVSIDNASNLLLAGMEVYKGNNEYSFLSDEENELQWLPIGEHNKSLANKDKTTIEDVMPPYITWVLVQLMNSSDDNSIRVRFRYLGNGTFEKFNVSIDEVTLNLYLQNAISSDITSKIGFYGPKIQPIIEFIESPPSQYKTGTHYTSVRISKSSGQPLENFEVIFEVLNSHDVPISYSIAISNSEGIASASLKFEQTGESFSIRVRVVDEGIYASTTTQSGHIRVVNDFILMRDFFIQFIPYIIIAIIALISISAIRYQRHVKLKKKWSEKSLILDDLIKISHIMVIHKQIGVLLYDKQISSKINNADLISGFLHAISQFKGEFNGDRTNSTTSKGFEMDYYDFKIIIADGNYVRAAFILDGTPSQTTKDRQREFVEYFEKKHDKHLRTFDGAISSFQTTDAILEHYFNTTLINPLQLDQAWSSVKLKGLEKALVEVAEQIQKERKVFFVSSLLNFALAGRKASRDEIISTIINLKNQGIFVPVIID